MTYEKNREHFSNRYPTLMDLAERAKKRVPQVAWAYLEGGTGDEELLQRNRNAFQQISFVPRFCLGPLKVDMETKLFGKTYTAPIGMAPVGLTGLMWPKAEHYLAATANRLQIPFCLSTVATETPETIGKDVGDMGWFQLYPPKDTPLLQSLLQRARDTGFHTLVVTADVPMASRRERSKRAGLSMPPKITPKMLWQGLTHPSWTYRTLLHGLPRLRTVEHYTNNNDMKFVSGFVGNRLGGTLDWDYCRKLKDIWKGPMVLKGILHPKDAEKAVEIGLDGIYVSNHGGRQFNGALTALEALPHIVKQVQGKVPILFDSGIRTGLDAMRALYLGADFVLVGRPFIWGVAALGKYGGDHTAQILIDDLQNNMVQLGVETIAELRKSQITLS
ncbi:alpha-hydroxy acid oxidase [Ulvibacterium sp.]|uniref:alpha-hydroxy acid oxidase n=1 Tax=Ulvibacterium sp. TaxID=2665914 RepID=UPI002618A08A|nr:alpha-hydroxy acid oxidase [Ulvibacterium sp.]